jgi:hypothetical protein
MDHFAMDYTQRIRINPTLMQQLRARMLELGYHADQHMHLGPMTWLFAHREWIMVSKSGHGRSALYPPDKTISDVVAELGDW